MDTHSPSLQLPQNISLLDAVTFIATLVSRPSDIDQQLDRVRSITAQLSAHELTQEDEAVLGEVYVYVEDYFVNKESLRSFTRESIREKLGNQLQDTPQLRKSH